MKIVALIGSFRKGSYNRMVFNHYRELAQGRCEFMEGAQSGIPIYNDDERERGLPPAVKQLAEQIQSANAVMVFSPEYNYSIPGGLKNTIDWLSRVQPQPFAGKKAAIVSASPGKLGGARMQYHLRQVAVFLDLQVMNKPEVMISEVHKKVDSQGRIADEDTKKFLASHFQAVMTWIGG